MGSQTERITTADWGSRLVEESGQRGRLCLHIARRILGNSAEAEDVVQSAFLRAWECREEIRDLDALPAWLLRVVVNLSLERLRRRRVECDGRGQRPVMAATPSPTRQIALREAVLTAMAELPEMTRLVVVLRLMEGRSGAETGQLLQRSMSEVSRHLHAGMDRLRVLLADWRDEPAAWSLNHES